MKELLSVFNASKQLGLSQWVFFSKKSLKQNYSYLNLLQNKFNQINLENNDHKGKLSRKAITGLRNSINWLCLAAKKKRVYVKKQDKNFYFKVNFITLTLPDTEEPISSQDLQTKLLNPWLTYMRKYHTLKNYVWRLEFQANGKLHIHISTDAFIHHKAV